MNEDREALTYVCHEIANPVNALLLKLHLIKSGRVEEFRSRNKKDLVESAIFDIQRISRVIADARTFSEFKNSTSSNHEIFSLSDFLEDFLSSFVGKKEKDTRIAYYSTCLGKIKADKVRISQAIGNILENAIKFSPDGSEISVSIFEKPCYVQVDIKDQGPGIKKCEFEKIFLNGYKSDSRSKEGFGLGLYLAKRIVSDYGGEIVVSSTEECGSTFSINIPSYETSTKLEPYERKFFSSQSFDRLGFLHH